MYRLSILILSTLFLSAPVWAQESAATDPDTPESDSAETVDEASDEGAGEDEAGDEDSDELYSEEDEDVFIPSEDVGFGQSIPFPSDI